MTTRQPLYGAAEFGRARHELKSGTWIGLAWCGTRLVQQVSPGFGVPCRRCSQSKRLAGH